MFLYLYYSNTKEFVTEAQQTKLVRKTLEKHERWKKTRKTHSYWKPITTLAHNLFFCIHFMKYRYLFTMLAMH